MVTETIAKVSVNRNVEEKEAEEECADKEKWNYPFDLIV
jgi:hypothetical protein